MRLVALALLVVPGCYCSHAREEPDGGPDAPIDGGPIDGGQDAGPEGDRHWVLVEGPFFELASERCELFEGATPILRVRGTIDLCDEPANVRWSVDHAARRITLTPALWRPVGGPACPPGTQTFALDVSLVGHFLEAGAWEAVLEDGSARVAFTVASGPPELPCEGCRAAGERCAVDQECAGPLRCVAMRGDAVCASMCALPCNPFPRERLADGRAAGDLGCTAALGVAATCEDDPGFGPICHVAARDLCPPCSAGTTCNEGGALATCDWLPHLAESVGGACTTDADCPSGASCVDGEPVRGCVVRCRSDHPCPGGASCDALVTTCPILIRG